MQTIEWFFVHVDIDMEFQQQWQPAVNRALECELEWGIAFVMQPTPCCSTRSVDEYFVFVWNFFFFASEIALSNVELRSSGSVPNGHQLHSQEMNENFQFPVGFRLVHSVNWLTECYLPLRFSFLVIVFCCVFRVAGVSVIAHGVHWCHSLEHPYLQRISFYLIFFQFSLSVFSSLQFVNFH